MKIKLNKIKLNKFFLKKIQKFNELLQSKAPNVNPSRPQAFHLSKITQNCHVYYKEHNLKKNVFVAHLTIGSCKKVVWKCNERGFINFAFVDCKIFGFQVK